MTNKVSEAFGRAGQSAISVAKLILQCRRATVTGAKPDPSGRIIILGNGPSLNDTIAEHKELLKHTPAMAVNFFANTPVFSELRPSYYILIDPLFFGGSDGENFRKLNENLAAVDWPMTLIVPVKYRDRIAPGIRANTHITILTVNAIAIEGWRWLTDMAYTAGLGMPRPRNVLIPAIMAAIQMGYRQIYIVGADHSWMRTIEVNERNEVVSVQPHFYKEDEKEEKRIRTDYLRYPLHEIVHSFYVAFKSYHDIRRYADRHGIEIFNSTPGSYIDAFPRCQLTMNN